MIVFNGVITRFGKLKNRILSVPHGVMIAQSALAGISNPAKEDENPGYNGRRFRSRTNQRKSAVSLMFPFTRKDHPSSFPKWKIIRPMSSRPKVNAAESSFAQNWDLYLRAGTMNWCGWEQGELICPDHFQPITDRICYNVNHWLAGQTSAPCSQPDIVAPKPFQCNYNNLLCRS